MTFINKFELGENLNNILELRNITKFYKKSKKNFFDKISYVNAVKDINLFVKEGEILGIVGESGCGKSTLAGIIIRLIKNHEGQVFFKNKNITNLSEKKLKYVRSNIQIVFQNTYSSLNPSKNIGWILKESLFLNNEMSKKEKEYRIEEVLYLVGLDKKYKKKYSYELSGGERQRICIASAVILKPKLIIADEAVSALDVSIQSQILDLFLDLKRELNLSYIFISHDLNVVNYLSDRIAVMNKGRIVELNTAYEIYNNPQNEYTKKLYTSIPKL